MPHRPDITGSASSGGGGSGTASDSRAGTYFLGRYRVVDEIGIGGMASVHLARMDGLGGFQKWVAIKKIHAHLLEDESFVQMFLDEARIVARISHSNVATVFELGKHEDCYWIAMEYLHGEPLRELMRRTEELGTPMPPEIACRVIADAAEGLHAAHELLGKNGEKLQLVHRDVTPHNLFVTYDGTTKVVDFGIAKFASRISNTRAGTLKGKLAYMSPEQVHGEPIDRRTDLFALGVVLWELTTGQRLFRMDNDLDTLAKVQECNVPRPSSLVRGYPIDLEKIVMKVLARNRNERFKTARELSRALQSLLMRRGLFIASDEVASYVQSIFAERIQKREAHLRWAAEVTQTINVDALRPVDPNTQPVFDSANYRGERVEAKPPPPARLPTPRPAAGMPARRDPKMMQTSETPSLETPATGVRPYDDGPTLQGELPDFGYAGGEDFDDNDDTLVAKSLRSDQSLALEKLAHPNGPPGTGQLPPVAPPIPAAGRPVEAYHPGNDTAAMEAPLAPPPPFPSMPQQSAFPGDFQHAPTLPAQPNPFMPDPQQPPMDPRWAASMAAMPQQPAAASPMLLPDRDNRTIQARGLKHGIPMWVVALASGLVALLFVGAIYLLLSGTWPADKDKDKTAGSATPSPVTSGVQGPFASARDAFTSVTTPAPKPAPSPPKVEEMPATPAPSSSGAPPAATPPAPTPGAGSQTAGSSPTSKAQTPAATPTPAAGPAPTPIPMPTSTSIRSEPAEKRAERSERPGKPEKLGLLTVICKPNPCEQVLDNGKLLGPSPIYRQSVPVGEHTLTLKTSSPPVTKTVKATVAADELSMQQVNMAP